jgi:hypothetical protein
VGKTSKKTISPGAFCLGEAIFRVNYPRNTVDWVSDGVQNHQLLHGILANPINN